MDAIEIIIHETFEEKLLTRFTSEMNVLTEPCVIVIDIKSEGGYCEVLERMAEMVAKKKEEGFVFVTNVDEYAYSCAFVMFLLGDIKICDPKADFMNHSAGIHIKDERITAYDAKEIFESLNEYDKVFDRIILENTDLTPEMFSFIKKNTTFFNREDLILLGIMQNEYSLN